jgi:hypothetical protein
MEIAHGTLNGLSPENFEKREAFELRCHNANYTTTMADGKVYLAPGGGLMASGDCWEDKLNCDKILSELDYWQKIVTHNEANIRTALSWPTCKWLSIKMTFDNQKCCLSEATKGIRIALRFSDATS